MSTLYKDYGRLRVEVMMSDLIDRCENIDELNRTIQEVAEALGTAAMDMCCDMGWDQDDLELLL